MHAVAVSRSIEVARGGRQSPETMGYDGRRLALALAVAACWAAETTRGAAAWGAPRPAAPCMYVFGDSLVDNGNNNFIVSMARANYPPYGIDFAGGPSGRFSNGLTTVDVLGNKQR